MRACIIESDMDKDGAADDEEDEAGDDEDMDDMDDELSLIHI